MRMKFAAFGVVVASVAAGLFIASIPRRPALGSAPGPMSYTLFCERYPDDCTAKGPAKPVDLTGERRSLLESINAKVNGAIAPKSGVGLAEKWAIYPSEGNCGDYVMTKRHELLKQGWPSSALLASEVRLPNGEHHLVLLVRTGSGDLVLDNLKPDIRPQAEAAAEYRWLRTQTAEDPKLWTAPKV